MTAPRLVPDVKGLRTQAPRHGSLRIQLGRVALVAALIGSWELAIKAGIVSSYDLSTPDGVARAFWEQITSSVLWDNTYQTAKATTLGFVIGSAIGIMLGLILGTSRYLDRVTSPFLAMGNSMPRIALAPLFIIWFGITMWAKVWLAVSIVVFVLLYNTKSATQTVDAEHRVMARMLDMRATERFRKVILPTCLPAIMAGLRLGVIFSLLGVIASEMIASPNGLGQLALEASSSFRVDRLFAILLVIAGMAVVMNAGIDLLERRVIRWHQD